jgi:hypothetical protein
MRTILLGHGETFVSGIDTNNVEAERSCKLDSEMTKTTSRPDQGNPLSTLEVGRQYTIPDRSPSTCKWCCTFERYLIRNWSRGPGIHKRILSKEAISVHARVSFDVCAILSPCLRAVAVLTVATGMIGKSTHDTISDLEVLDSISNRSHSACTLM